MSAKLCSLIPDNYARAIKEDDFLAKKTLKNYCSLVSVSNRRSVSQIHHVTLTSSSVSFSMARKITIGWLQKRMNTPMLLDYMTLSPVRACRVYCRRE
jgi:hypothetical protein